MAKPLLLSVPEAAKALGKSERTIYRRAAIGKYTINQDPKTGRNRVPLSQLKKEIEPGLYTALKAALEAGEKPLPLSPAKKPPKRPVKKAKGKK